MKAPFKGPVHVDRDGDGSSWAIYTENEYRVAGAMLEDEAYYIANVINAFELPSNGHIRRVIQAMESAAKAIKDFGIQVN